MASVHATIAIRHLYLLEFAFTGSPRDSHDIVQLVVGHRFGSKLLSLRCTFGACESRQGRSGRIAGELMKRRKRCAGRAERRPSRGASKRVFEKERVTRLDAHSHTERARACLSASQQATVQGKQRNAMSAPFCAHSALY